MMKIHSLAFALALCFLVSIAHCFTIPRTASSLARGAAIEPLKFAKGGNSEYSVIEEDDNDEFPSDYTVLDTTTAAATEIQQQQQQQQEEEASSSSNTSQSHHPQQRRFEYAAFSPGATTTLQIQVGDLALARKAWKKRRRSGSPLLVPCSVLNMDRASMLRGNMVYLLYKFGKPQKDGVVLPLAELKRRHKSHLKGQLTKHATALGYEDSRQLVEALFEGRAIQDNWGARLVVQTDDDDDNDEIYLKSPLSKYRALQKAAQATLLQVTNEDDEAALDTMKHTGYIRQKREEENGNDNIAQQEKSNKKPYKFPPLSAAIRVSQKEDVETGNIQQGTIHPAVFFGFDDQGDGGSPLLTLSLNPARRPTTKRVTTNNNRSGKIYPKYTPIRNPRHMIDDLHVGEGPFDARVVRLGKDHALIDFGVGRRFSQQQQQTTTTGGGAHPIGTPDFVKVYGMLRFKDAIDPDSVVRELYDDEHDNSKSPPQQQQQQQQSASAEEEDVFASMQEMLNKMEDDLDQVDDGEEIEDITHLFSLNEDGSLSYSNPETGETEIVNSMDDEEEDDDNDDESEIEEEEEEEEDEPVTFDVGDMSSHLKRLQKPRTIRLHVGDRVPVHILSVSKQSSQFMVTTDPSAVKGKKAKDIKKQSGVSKKLQRLSQMLGGLDKAEELRGREYRGTVKATSQTGDWLYVQPNTESEGDDDFHLPVGVATIDIPQELASEYEPSSFAQGDLVRIQLDGIDESRGQLAMRVIEKLSP